MFDYGSIFTGGRVHVIPFTQTSDWTHIAVISSAAKDRMYIYVNGTLMRDQAGHATHSSTKTFSFGSTTGLYYNGEIDEFRVYDRPISGAEALALATAGPMGIPHITQKPVISAFPNPSNRGVYHITGSSIIKSVKIYDITGATISELNNINGTGTVIDLRNTNPAMYFAAVQFADNSRTMIKLVKSE
jgi:hypothetical protein